MSVAVSESPTGPFEFYGHVGRPDGSIIGTKIGDIMQFDPGIFVDDDGRIFLYSGFAIKGGKNAGAITLEAEGGYVMELEADMLTVKYEPKLILPGFESIEKEGAPSNFKSFEGHQYYEAPSMRKIGGVYYLVYSSIHSHELCYATSHRPDGDFIFGGTIVSIGDIYLNGRTGVNALNHLGNTHGGMINVKGQWYIFYHRQTNRHDVSRQCCAEPIIINEDGTINQVEVTSCGLNGGPLRGIGQYEARIACNLQKGPYFTQDGPDREADVNGYGQYIANMCDGAMAGFKYFAFEEAKNISVRVRGDAVGKLLISTETGLVCEISINAAQDWKDFMAEMNPLQGKHALYFTYKGEGYLDFLSFEFM